MKKQYQSNLVSMIKRMKQDQVRIMKMADEMMAKVKAQTGSDKDIDQLMQQAKKGVVDQKIVDNLLKKAKENGQKDPEKEEKIKELIKKANNAANS